MSKETFQGESARLSEMARHREQFPINRPFRTLQEELSSLNAAKSRRPTDDLIEENATDESLPGEYPITGGKLPE